MLKLRVKKLVADAKIPQYAKSGDAGMDVSSIEEKVLKAGEFAIVKTGIAIILPKGCECQVRSRSGLAAKKGVFVLNAPGTIDEGYRGEIGVILANMSKEDFKIEKGDRIAQLVIKRVPKVKVSEVFELDKTERGGTGFGSSGVK